MMFNVGDLVQATDEITSSGGWTRPVPVGAEGVITYVFPERKMVSPFDGLDYRYKVRFGGYVNLCPCRDGAYHVREDEIRKTEITDEDIFRFLDEAA